MIVFPTCLKLMFLLGHDSKGELGLKRHIETLFYIQKTTGASLNNGMPFISYVNPYIS